jgi:predicted dithiol-disulfide oxidoreductase (DUF899 family)
MPIVTPPSEEDLANHPVVTPEVWLAARRALLRKEKELTRLNDELSTLRRQLPWVRVTKDYRFQAASGEMTLADLFADRSQLIVYHFMYGPGWKEGCSGCSFLADHFDGANLHLQHHDVTLLAVSRAPLHELEPFKKRMGWRFPWVSSHGSDFNYDFHASSSRDNLASGRITYNFHEVDSDGFGEEHHGISVFLKRPDESIFHTYSCYSRGVDILCGTHNFLDLTPLGRNEHEIMDWIRHHDRYDTSTRKCAGPDC